MMQLWEFNLENEELGALLIGEEHCISKEYQAASVASAFVAEVNLFVTPCITL